MVSLSSSVYCNVFGAFNGNQYNFSQESFLILGKKKKKKIRGMEKVGEINKIKILLSLIIFFSVKK